MLSKSAGSAYTVEVLLEIQRIPIDETQTVGQGVHGSGREAATVTAVATSCIEPGSGISGEDVVAVAGFRHQHICHGLIGSSVH